MDVGDNIGGGSSADSTYLLAEAKRLGIRRFLQTLYDPEAVTRLRGGRRRRHRSRSPSAARPTTSTAIPSPSPAPSGSSSTASTRIPCPTHGGWRFFDGGTTAVLDTTDDHTLVLTSKRTGNTSLEQLYSVGVNPERFKVVVAKGVVSPRPAYSRVAKEIVLVNTPGVTTSDLSFFTYHRRRTPLYPFEPDATY